MGKLKILNRYATIPNHLLNDKSISLKAKGMYAFIQSKPEGWDFSAEKISHLIREGLPTVQSTLKELEASGYLSRFRFQNEKGYWDVTYELFEFPSMPDVWNDKRIYMNPDHEIVYAGNPYEENPIVGKPSNISNKDFSNKENNKTIIKTERDLLFDSWFEYKKEKKQKYTDSGKNALIKKWIDKSDFQLEQAIENSMSNNWSGLIELKQQNNYGNTTEKLGTSAARMEALRKW